MKSMRIAMSCVVATALLTAALNLQLTAQEKKPPENVQGKSWTIVLKDVAVQPKNDKEEDWDAFEGKPDIRVYLKNLSEPKSKDFTSETKMDTFFAEYNVPTINVREGQEVEIHVIDVDIAFNDEIGKKKLKITREMLDKGKMELSFAQVDTLRIELKIAPVANPKENGHGTPGR